MFAMTALVTPQGIALTICFALLFIALLVVLEIRSRTWCDNNLRTLLNQVDAVKQLLSGKFTSLDADGDGNVTMEDLDEVLASGVLSPQETRLTSLVRSHIDELGHMIDNGCLPMGVAGCPPYAVYWERNGISRNDINHLRARLEAAIGRLGRNPAITTGN